MALESKMEPAAILKKPYARIVVPEADGSFTAEILEFPGCVASGESAADALANVEDVALDWIDATLEQGQNIPEPLDNAQYSGKLVLRMSKGLHKRAAKSADREGISLNQFIVTCLAEHVGERAATRRSFVTPTPFFQNINAVVFGSGGAKSVSTGATGYALETGNVPQLTGNPWGQHA